jgi:hypothetical protein
MSKTNKLWHAQHRMPKNPTPEQRIEWHVEHARHCRCRPIPESVLAMLGDRVIETPLHGEGQPADGEPGSPVAEN